MSPLNALPPPPSPQAGRPVRQPVGSEINLFDYIGVILRRWKIVVLVFLVVFTVVLYKTMCMKPVYQAFSTIRIMENKDRITQMNPSYWVDPTATMNTELATIKSRYIAEKVAEQQHLNWQVSQKTQGFSFKILEFTTAAKDALYHIKMTSPATFEVRDGNGKLIGGGEPGVLLTAEGFSLLLSDVRGKAGDSFELGLIPLEDAAMQISGGFNATVFEKDTNIIKATYTSTDPVQARDMVNAFVRAYIDHSVAFKTEDTKKTVAFIDEQIKALRGDLENSETKLQDYKSGRGILQLDNEVSALVSKISAMETKIAELKLKENELLSQFTGTHPAVKSVRMQIRAAQGQLGAAEQQIKKLPVVEQDLTKLTRVSKVNSDIFTFLLQKREEARIAVGSAISNLEIIDRGILPKWPISPNVPKNLLLGVLAGLGLGIALAFLLEYLDDTIKDADQAKRAIGLPLLGTIPQIEGRGARRKELTHQKTVSEITAGELSGKEIVNSTNALIAKNEPKSLASEAFRALRTGLHFSAISKDKKIMIFTSTFPKEGKSVISANTAVVIAQTGARVLLIDCDLRRSSQHEKFGVRKTPGLSEVLARDVTFQEAVNTTAMPGLDLLCAGTNPPNPSELLGSEAMRDLLVTQRENYDYIIVDAPPVLAVTDAPVLTTVCDLVVLVMEAGRVPIKAAQQMREILDRLHAPIAGFVMNDKTGKGEHYGYYGSGYFGKAYGYRHGYGYGYGYGYGDYSDEEPGSARKGFRWENFIPDKILRNFEKFLGKK
ncbi:MAG: polysaccharide biosynthesis tyrosine autokinase [Smithella sp.]